MRNGVIVTLVLLLSACGGNIASRILRCAEQGQTGCIDHLVREGASIDVVAIPYQKDGQKSLFLLLRSLVESHFENLLKYPAGRIGPMHEIGASTTSSTTLASQLTAPRPVSTRWRY